MTETQKTQTIPEPGREGGVSPDGGPEGSEPQEPRAEPMTPESVLKWNAYYDVYVVLGVLLLTFILSANRITHSSIWNQLTVGKEIARTGRPVTTNLFSYVEPAKSWVNIPWLFDWASALIFKAASDLSPVDVTDPSGSASKAEQVGAGALVALNALIRVGMALLILRIRRPGPGAWWAAVCAALAVALLYSPLGVIATAGTVSPATWGLALLALELLLIHRATQGSRLSAYGLAPLFLLWANVDVSFLPGLMILTAVAIGRVRPSSTDAPGAFPLPMALGVLAASAAVCLANPSVFRVYPAALDWLFVLFRPAGSAVSLDQLSFFGSKIREPNVVAAWRLLFTVYGVLVALGVGSFWLNRKRFNLGRFLAFAVVAVLWGTMLRFAGEFAVVLAVVLILNGQEWYHDAFGADGKPGLGWSVWSVGGRLVTIALLFFGVWDAITGYYGTRTGYTFGFGFDRDDYPFEATEFLKNAPIKGNVLNTLVKQGDALVYIAYPNRKTYIDSRSDLFSPSVNDRLQEVRRNLLADDEAAWKPFLDEYGVSVVMIQPSESPNTYRTLMESPRWVPFHDDGNTVLFGRADAQSAEDQAFFKAMRLDPALQAFKVTRGTPSPDRPPSDITWIDTIYQDKVLARPQPHAEAARRWLLGAAVLHGDTAAIPDPARCLMAIREARTALASKPDDTLSYRVLARAYRALMTQESALLAGMKLAPETAALLERIPPRPDQLMTRFRERVTALSYAIKTTPPPSDEAGRHELQELNMELSQLYASVNFLDLARDRLRVFESLDRHELSVEERTRLVQQLGSLDEQIKKIETRMNDMSVEEQAPPLRLALFAIENGAPGLALRELIEADNSASTPGLVKPRLLDLYCDVGAPDKAVEMLTSGQIEDPNFGTEPGESAMRQGRAYFLQGNTEYAATLWEKYAIPRLRHERGSKALAATTGLARGDVQEAARMLLDIPDKIALQSNWEFEAGICRLEEGMPVLAADHFTQALKLVPRSMYRPILAYYLEQIGRPVPPVGPAADTKKTDGETPARPKDAKPETAR